MFHNQNNPDVAQHSQVGQPACALEKRRGISGLRERLSQTVMEIAPQVFISYASADKAIADRVCDALEKAGVPCWIAPRDIPPGVDYPAAIVEAVRSARALVLLLTEHATGSPHVLSEVGHAFSGKKRIIPFRLSAAPLPEDLEYFLSMTQWLDAPEGCTDGNLKRLTDATREALAGGRTVRGPALVGCRSEFVTADAAGGVRVFPLDGAGIGGVSVDVATEFAS
jgi:hypothetical protein